MRHQLVSQQRHRRRDVQVRQNRRQPCDVVVRPAIIEGNNPIDQLRRLHPEDTRCEHRREHRSDCTNHFANSEEPRLCERPDHAETRHQFGRDERLAARPPVSEVEYHRDGRARQNSVQERVGLVEPVLLGTYQGGRDGRSAAFPPSRFVPTIRRPEAYAIWRSHARCTARRFRSGQTSARVNAVGVVPSTSVNPYSLARSATTRTCPV